MKYRLVNIELSENTQSYKLLGRDYDSAIYKIVKIPSAIDRFLYKCNFIDLSPIVCYYNGTKWCSVDGKIINNSSLIDFLYSKKWLLHNYNKEIALKEDDYQYA